RLVTTLPRAEGAFLWERAAQPAAIGVRRGGRMAITIRCPSAACGARASVAEGVSGRDVKCKRCGTAFTARPTVVAHPADTQANRPAAAVGDPFPTLPAEFGRYRVLKLLGKGGM